MQQNQSHRRFNQKSGLSLPPVLAACPVLTTIALRAQSISCFVESTRPNMKESLREPSPPPLPRTPQPHRPQLRPCDSTPIKTKATVCSNKKPDVGFQCIHSRKTPTPIQTCRAPQPPPTTTSSTPTSDLVQCEHVKSFDRARCRIRRAESSNLPLLPSP